MTVTNCGCGKCYDRGSCCVKCNTAGGLCNTTGLAFSYVTSTEFIANQWGATTATAFYKVDVTSDSIMGLDPAITPNVNYVGITLGCQMKGNGAEVCPEAGIRFRVQSNGSSSGPQMDTDLNNWVSNTFGGVTNVKWRLWVKVRDLYTDSVQPTGSGHAVNDSNGNPITTSYPIDTVCMYQWPYEKSDGTKSLSGTTTEVCFPDSTNQFRKRLLFAKDIETQTHPWPTRGGGCVNIDLTCLNSQECVWGKDPDFYLELVKVDTDSGFASTDLFNEGDPDLPVENCDPYKCVSPCTSDSQCFGFGATCDDGCCSGSKSLGCCDPVTNNEYAAYAEANCDLLTAGCCCAKYIQWSKVNGTDTSICDDMDGTCFGCQCCEGLNTDIGCGVCTDDVLCLDPTWCALSPICCNTDSCIDPGNCPQCYNGVDCPGCFDPFFCKNSDGSSCVDDGVVNTYTCLELSYTACQELRELTEVEWTCFSGRSTCEGGPDSQASCPCIQDINNTVEENGCGCYDVNPGPAPAIFQCNSAVGRCKKPINNADFGDSCAGENVFKLTAYDFRGNLQTSEVDGETKQVLKLSTTPVYRDQYIKNQCSFTVASVSANWGHLDPCYSVGDIETCCTTLCSDGACVYSDVHPKLIKSCLTDTAVGQEFCFTCGNNAPSQTLAAGAFLNFELNKLEDILFVRDEYFARLQAKTVVNDEFGTNLITTTNAHYSFPSDGIDSATNWDELLGENNQLFTMLPNGWESDASNKESIINEFKKLDSTWKIDVFCNEEARDFGSYDLIRNQGGWWDTLEPNHNANVWLLIKSDNHKGIYKTRESFGDCTPSSNTKYRYTVDHYYKGNSETERGYSDCYTQDGTNCADDNTCKYCNPWRAANDDNESKCNMYTDSPSAGDHEFPIQPHTYGIELWYKGVLGSPCDDNTGDTDFPDNFRLAAIVQETVSCGASVIDSEQQSVNDTCSTYYYQCQDRVIEKRPYIVGPETEGDNVDTPWNKPLNTTVEFDGETIYRHPGVDGSVIPRVIKLEPVSFGAMARASDDTAQEEIDFITPASSVAWEENLWYNVDPRHKFSEVAKGIPQASGRWTELPFKNYASDYIDASKTIKGFYLTLSAYHLRGINAVEMYLDGATSTTLGSITIREPKEHPLEPAKAQIVKDDSGNLLTGLQEYTAGIYTESLSTGVHEVRAKILPKAGSARFLYGEPPTGDASVNVTDLINPVKGSTSYQVISGSDQPFSKAMWPAETPDGPPIVNNLKSETNLMEGVDRQLNNPKPNWGANNFWNMHNNGFKYYATSGHAASNTFTTYNKDTYVYGGTPQKELLLNGYESFWFNYNPAPLTVYVGQSGDTVPDGSQLFESLSEAFSWLESNYTADNTALHDAEIVLIAGTKASPRKYNWINSYIGESLPSSTGWCQNALQKKSFVIRSENPDDKEGTILWFPPSQDRVVMPWNNFALHVRDLTVYTASQRGETGKTCFHSSGTNCRLLVENVVFASACSTGIKASALVDSSGDVICGDSLRRASNGSVTGQIDYSKCRNINTTTNNIECAKNTSDCASVTCCGAKVTGGCEGCTGANCDRCRKNCTCRSTEIDWWPFFCSDDFDMDSSGTTLEPVILCGNNDCTGPSWNCKGIFGSDIVTSSSFMCLGTQPEHCVMLGAYNHDLMDLASDSEWDLGLFGKDIECQDVPGSSLRNPVLMKHLLVDNYNKNLISDTGHGMIIDVWAKNADPYTASFVPDLDIIKWDAYAVDQYSRNVVQDYNSDITSPNPRYIKNFNCFIENRMMVNVKVDNCHGRVINMKGPDLKYRDFLSRSDAYWNGYSGHHCNYGMPSIRNFVFKDIHINDKKNSDQVFGNAAINHLYIDNFVISTDSGKFCESTDASTAACRETKVGGLFNLANGNVDEQFGSYLHYGRKQIQNLYLANSLFQNLGTGKYSWDSKGSTIYTQSSGKGYYQNNIDWGTSGRAGHNFRLSHPTSYRLPVSYFWSGSFKPVVKAIRHQFTDRENSRLIGNNQTGTSNVSSGPVVHRRVTAPLGRTVGSSGCDFGLIKTNNYSSDDNFLADYIATTGKQSVIFGGLDANNRITVNKPEYSTTHISGSSFKTADNKTACFDTTLGTCSGESDPFQFPSEAHSNLIAAAEALTSGNILSQAIPNVGGMKLSFTTTNNYYHDICEFNSLAETCRKIATLDARNTTEVLTKVTESGGTYSWTTNTLADCNGSCVYERDHFFVNNDNKQYRVDLDWIPIIDECTCSDLTS